MLGKNKGKDIYEVSGDAVDDVDHVIPAPLPLFKAGVAEGWMRTPQSTKASFILNFCSASSICALRLTIEFARN
jgi:hypothetical protein